MGAHGGQDRVAPRLVALLALALLACCALHALPRFNFRCPPPPASAPQRAGRPMLQPYPGADAASLVRIEGGAIVFETVAGPDEVRRFYAETFAAEGWRVGTSGLPFDDRFCPALALRLTVYGEYDGRTRYFVGMDATPCAVPPC